MIPNTRVLILAGGRGMRLWPYSNQRLPKQFLSINRGPSSFIQAVERALCIASEKDVFISTNKENFLHVKRQLRTTGLGNDQILVKEDNYETGLSIFSALKQLKERFGAHDEDILVVLPSDHFINPLEKFAGTMQDAVTASKQYGVVVLGKKPTAPEESFGYIVLDKKNEDGKTYQVKQFIEKPPRSTAENLIQEASCFWNLGIFTFPVGVMMTEFSAHFGVDDYREIKDEMLAQASGLSFDRMIIENTRTITALEAGFRWLDIGSWKAFHEILEKDAFGNANLGNQILVDSKNSLVTGRDDKPIVAVGLDGVFIIDHRDALLVVSESHVDALKKAMPFLAEKYPRLVEGSPFVSLCTPLSVQRKFVSATVDSVLRQDYPLIEHLVVAPGASEEIEDLEQEIENMRQKYPKDEKTVDIVRGPAGASNLYDTLNFAVRESTGDIIGILNDGDILEDDTVVRAIVDAMEKENADVFWADLRYVAESDVNRTTRFWQSTPYRKGLFNRGWMPPHPTFFVRRWVYEKYGLFRTDLHIAGGYEFMLRVLEKEGVRGCYLPKIVVRMREVDRGALSRIVNSFKGNVESYRAWELNGLVAQPWFVFVKPLSKVRQLFSKSRIINL